MVKATTVSLWRNYLDPDHERLNRIEVKIDNLAGYMVAIARAEEKLVSLEVARQNFREELEQAKDRITTVEREATAHEAALSMIKRIFWTVISTIITGVVGVATIGVGQ